MNEPRPISLVSYKNGIAPPFRCAKGRTFAERKATIAWTLCVAFLGAIAGCIFSDEPVPPPTAPVEAQVAPAELKPSKSKTTTEAISSEKTREKPPTLISKVTLKDQKGKVLYRGDIDLQPTLDRIVKGEKNEHHNDGSVFRNREGHLPRQPSGYYHEYVVPTPKERGPGPQRLIIGREGEVYYTADHYQSFRKIDINFNDLKRSP